MVPWKNCAKHGDFKYLYGSRCPHCIVEQQEKPVKQYVIFDQDSILAALDKSWFAEYNRLHDDDLHMDKVTKWETHEFCKAGVKVYDVLHTPGLYRNLEPIPGALETVKAVYDAVDKNGDKRFEVDVISASESDVAFAEKKQWLHEHLPFLSKRDIGFWHKKYRIACDYFIDDSPHNIRAMRAAQPLCQILTIAYPYNADVTDLCNLRAESYKDYVSAWKQIRDYLKV